YMVIENVPLAIETWDLICVGGARCLRFIESEIADVAPEVSKQLRDRLALVGYPALDGVGQLAEGSAIRAKYGLPADRPIVYISTAPVLYPLISSSRILRGLVMRFRGEMNVSPGGLLAYAASLRYPFLVPYRQ